MIKENNLIENGINAYFDVKLFSLNVWFKNYWSDWHTFLPKPIYGRCMGMPWLNFDWMPCVTPYGGEESCQ